MHRKRGRKLNQEFFFWNVATNATDAVPPPFCHIMTDMNPEAKASGRCTLEPCGITRHGRNGCGRG
jgi:hypothetical protein